MPRVLCADGVLVDGWAFSAGDVVSSVTSATLRELQGGGVRRLVACSRLTRGQILRLAARPKRWLSLRRAGRRLVALGLVELAERLQLGERELVYCCQRASRPADFVRRVFRDAPTAPRGAVPACIPPPAP